MKVQKQTKQEKDSLDEVKIIFDKIQPLYLQPIVTQYLVCNKSEIWP